jgi:hypothetical protein
MRHPWIAGFDRRMINPALQAVRIEVEQSLAPVYERFTEGFETPNLQAAKATLASPALVS